MRQSQLVHAKTWRRVIMLALSLVLVFQAGNGQILLSTQVDQLIQAMAGFTAQTGLTRDQAIDQQPQDVQAILTTSWQ